MKYGVFFESDPGTTTDGGGTKNDTMKPMTLSLKGLKRLLMPETNILQYENIPEEKNEENRTLRLANEFFGAKIMNFSFLTFPPGEGGSLHFHNPPMEEFYFILEGNLDVTIGDDVEKATPGSVCYIPPGTHHRPYNSYSEPATMIATFAPLDAWNKNMVEE